MSRPLGRKLQCGGALEAERDVEALDALARRALDQVIQRRRDHRLLALRRDVDQAKVRVAGELGRGRLGDNLREWLARVELSIRILELRERALVVEGAGGGDGGGAREEVRDEG